MLQVPVSWWLSGLVVSTLLCVVGSSAVFGLPWYQPLFAVVLAMLVAVMAVRALGEVTAGGMSFILAACRSGCEWVRVSAVASVVHSGCSSQCGL